MCRDAAGQTFSVATWDAELVGSEFFVLRPKSVKGIEDRTILEIHEEKINLKTHIFPEDWCFGGQVSI